MIRVNRSSSSAFHLALVVLTLSALACGSSTPEVTLPNATSPSQENTQPAVAQPTLLLPTETPKPVGSARSNPAPLGSEVAIDEMTFIVTEIIAPANDIVKQGNQFNAEPEPGQQYIFVNISVTCNKSTDETCNLSGFEFSLIDSAGITYDVELFVAGVSGLFEAGDFYGEATKSGYLVFLSPEGDEGLILKYETFLGGEAYFALK